MRCATPLLLVSITHPLPHHTMTISDPSSLSPHALDARFDTLSISIWINCPHVTIVALNRPRKRNAMNAKVCAVRHDARVFFLLHLLPCNTFLIAVHDAKFLFRCGERLVKHFLYLDPGVTVVGVCCSAATEKPFRPDWMYRIRP